ncbi:hypothetical protein [Massilia varians]|uniref:hypothetical protein n=1 Tax=Massilia varians TaxID=457921 RepID=UPI00255544E9|nr:hypothetical protein [Massilia varians]MDK6080342.1 hypothetical protein [Massilia varians]
MYEFYRGERIDLVAAGEKLRQMSNKYACKRIEELKRVKRMSWSDFLTRAKKVDEQFLEVDDLAAEAWRGGQP